MFHPPITSLHCVTMYTPQTEPSFIRLMVPSYTEKLYTTALQEKLMFIKNSTQYEAE
jgi:hypothetical protein